MNIDTMEQFIPSSFTTKAGKQVQTKPHYATFNEKHNSSKAKVLIVLYHRRYKLEYSTGLSVSELSHQSGVDYGYIKSRVSKWVDWGYLGRTVTGKKRGRPVYTYKIANRGKHFVEAVIPKSWLDIYVSELRQTKQNNLLARIS